MTPDERSYWPLCAVCMRPVDKLEVEKNVCRMQIADSVGQPVAFQAQALKGVPPALREAAQSAKGLHTLTFSGEN